MAEMSAFMAEMRQGMAAINARLDKMDARFDKMDARFDKMDERLDVMDARLDTQGAQLVALSAAVAELRDEANLQRTVRLNAEQRLKNALKGLTAPLEPLKFDALGAVWPSAIAQPVKFIDIAIGGSENVPGGHATSGWNKQKSRAFLARALPGGYESDSDNEGENGDKARSLRMRVIECMGGRFERVVSSLHHL
jgi:uncharacterized coiled-coil protein SlyX